MRKRKRKRSTAHTRPRPHRFDRLRSLSYADTHVVMVCFSVRPRTSHPDRVIHRIPPLNTPRPRPGRAPGIARKRRGKVDPGSALLLRRCQSHPRRCALPPSLLAPFPMLTSRESTEMRPAGRPGGGCATARTANGRNSLVRTRPACRTAHQSRSVPRYVPRLLSPCAFRLHALTNAPRLAR